jgi:zinc protease
MTTFFILSVIMVLSLPFVAHALDIKKERLASGLTVILIERHELPIVMATLLIKASPLQEDGTKAGTAYLTAKMLSEGTAKRKSADISHQTDFMGASLETAVNDDFTTVSLSVLKKDVDTGFDLFSDIVLHPSFSIDELNRRKTLLAGSLKKREEDPSFIAGREFMKNLYGDIPYGRPVEGNIESIGRIGRHDIANFYDAHYRPDNSILVVVGDLGKDELARLIARYFSSWRAVKKPSGQERLVQTKRTAYKQPRIEVIDKDVSQANIVMGRAGISRDNPDYYAVQVMNYILGGGGFASRLMKIVRDEMGLTYSIHSLFSTNIYPGKFEIDVQTKNESAGLVIKETLKQIRRVRTEGISEEELGDAKDYLVGSFLRRIETSRKIADFLTAVQFYNLGDDYIEKYRDYIGKVTKDDVLRVARKYLSDEDILIVVVGNKKKLKL